MSHRPSHPSGMHAGAHATAIARWSRRDILLIAGLFALAGTRTASSAEAKASGTAFTADEKGGSVSAIDLASGKVRTQPLPVMPHNVQIGGDGRSLLLVGMAGHHGGGETGQLIVLDASDIARPARAEIAIGPHPAHVVTDGAGGRAFITDSVKNAVLVVDLAAGRIVREIPVGTFPHGLRLSPDGRELYIANMRGGDVSVVDVAVGREVKRIAVGKVPVQVGFTPDGAQVFVSLNGENKVAIIDRASQAVVARIAVGRNPVQVHATSDGSRVFVANQGTEASPANTVSVIDVAARRIAATIRVGRGAHGVVASGDGRWVFVSNIADATVSAIDAQALRVAATYRVGAGPNGITYRPAPARDGNPA